MQGVKLLATSSDADSISTQQGYSTSMCAAHKSMGHMNLAATPVATYSVKSN